MSANVCANGCSALRELVVELDFVHHFHRLAVDLQRAEAPVAHHAERLGLEDVVLRVLHDLAVDHAAVRADGVADHALVLEPVFLRRVGIGRELLLDHLERQFLVAVDVPLMAPPATACVDCCTSGGASGGAGGAGGSSTAGTMVSGMIVGATML